VYVSVYFISENQMTRTLNVIVGQVVNVRNVPLLFIGELGTDVYLSLFSVEGKEKLGIFFLSKLVSSPTGLGPDKFSGEGQQQL
jgi:hypothetical protein